MYPFRMILTLVISIINAKSPITTVYVLVAFLTYTILLLFPIRMLIHKVSQGFWE